MSSLSSIINDFFPAEGDVGVPTGVSSYILFDRPMNEDLLAEQFFIEGPDTDQFVGPGIQDFQNFPNNVSQGDDFLTSPGYRGIMQGSFSFQKISLGDPNQISSDPLNYRTKMIFTPSHPMAPGTEYVARLPEATDKNLVIYTGYIKFGWTTGSGSITALPTTASTSILNSISPISPLNQLTPFQLVKITPANRSIKNDPIKTNTITLEFNKNIDPTSVDPALIVLQTLPITDHPDLCITSIGDLGKKILVQGNKIIITI